MSKWRFKGKIERDGKVEGELKPEDSSFGEDFWSDFWLDVLAIFFFWPFYALGFLTKWLILHSWRKTEVKGRDKEGCLTRVGTWLLGCVVAFCLIEVCFWLDICEVPGAKRTVYIRNITVDGLYTATVKRLKRMGVEIYKKKIWSGWVKGKREKGRWAIIKGKYKDFNLKVEIAPTTDPNTQALTVLSLKGNPHKREVLTRRVIKWILVGKR
ncbi:MAG TPA: hypothetical protein ENG48_12455 [Candidatus Atribacteria bacterium]|nr:hypothetical protein [Candidatus Atribacteria bacterium]